MKNKYQGIQEVCNDWHYNKKLKKWFHEDSDDYNILERLDMNKINNLIMESIIEVDTVDELCGVTNDKNIRFPDKQYWRQRGYNIYSPYLPLYEYIPEVGKPTSSLIED